MDKNKIDEVMVPAIKKAKGIIEAVPFFDRDRQKVLETEQEAEKKSLMGLGKVTNSGVENVLNSNAIYVALTTMDFTWGSQASLILKKGEVIVGEEVQDKKKIAQLTNKKDVWFMHENFVIYKDKCAFPSDIMKKVCHFDTPCLSAEWCIVEQTEFQYSAIIYANPSPPCDTYLKERYFRKLDKKGLGTIMVGVNL